VAPATDPVPTVCPDDPLDVDALLPPWPDDPPEVPLDMPPFDEWSATISACTFVPQADASRPTAVNATNHRLASADCRTLRPPSRHSCRSHSGRPMASNRTIYLYLERQRIKCPIWNASVSNWGRLIVRHPPAFSFRDDVHRCKCRNYDVIHSMSTGIADIGGMWLMVSTS
jgi:hypothetical protein